MRNRGLRHFIPGIVLGAWLGMFASGIQAQTTLLLEDYPDNYVVVEGDTLWDIASNFLEDPWRWPEIWEQNQQVENPDLIYPGDVLVLQFVDGDPRIIVQRAAAAAADSDRPTSRLSPRIRESALPSSSIPEIVVADIANSLTENRIVSPELYEDAPYILANSAVNLIMGAGDEIYARGAWPDSANSFQIYRQGNTYRDPDTGESLGVELENKGTATVIAEAGEGVRRLEIRSSSKEILVGDRLLVREASPLDPVLYPQAPEDEVAGYILALPTNETMGSMLDTLVIGLGSRDNLRIGDVLSIRQQGTVVDDEVGAERQDWKGRLRSGFFGNNVQLPDKEVGTLLVYRTFEKLSYGMILEMSEPIMVGDIVASP
ncbi:MAG: LysM domain-containing protein [Pseudohongiellaceae bacterium]